MTALRFEALQILRQIADEPIRDVPSPTVARPIKPLGQRQARLGQQIALDQFLIADKSADLAL